MAISLNSRVLKVWQFPPTILPTQFIPPFLGLLLFENCPRPINACRKSTTDSPQASPKNNSLSFQIKTPIDVWPPKWWRMLHSLTHEDESNERMKKLCNILSASPKSDVEVALRKCKVQISPNLVEQVLKRFENAGLQALRFFEWAGRQEGYTHRVEAYHIMIDILGRIRQYQLMWNLINDMKSKGILKQRTFSVMIRRYVRAHKVQEAVETFEVMDTYGVPPDLVAFNSLLTALCKCKNMRKRQERCKNVIKAQEIFDKMKTRFVPDLRTYSILMEGWGNEPDLPRMRKLLREMIGKGCKPDVVVYVILINALCKGGKVDEAVNLLDEMKNRGCHPNPHAYGILIHTFGSEKRIEEALAIFDEMKENDCVPDTPTYNALIGAFFTARRYNDAYDVLDEMEQKSVRPNARTYNVFLCRLINRNKMEEAYKFFCRMIKCDCEPDNNTYTMMIKMFCEEDRLDIALEVWKHISRKQFCPNVHTFCALINGLCHKGKIKKACTYFEEMIEKGIRPLDATYDRLRRGLIKVGREDKLEDLLKKIKQLTEEPLNA
eukprot:Gb_22860 [translate_table: standard]